ncbi:carbohydrate ABC transporter permease [Yeguia hominis]|uniref:Sugar ABC transporter permease n=1 Tax=Yeguia hominis TaxID=2763662 RepID=A0A926HQU4_9FIRM|nr:sugar ABC transporter permease [Yeguia hominis]MBC8532578.1 sugar ABC transporter permease [Yeguia hominis]
MERILRDRKAIAVFVLPGLFVYTFFVFVPMLRSVYFTFFEGTPNIDMNFVGLDNYARLFTDKTFFDSLKITLIYLVWVAGGCVVLPLIASLILKYGLKRFVNTTRTVIYLPCIIPGVGVAALFSKMLEVQPNYGLINSLLSAVGLESMVKAWTGSSATALGTVIAADMWRGIGYYTIIFFAGLINIPNELDEAARIDGANMFQTIRKIVLPMLKPVTIMCAVLTLNNALKVYDMPRVLTKNGGPGHATEVLSLYMYRTAFRSWEYGYGSTLAVVILILTLVFTQVVSRLDRETD